MMATKLAPHMNRLVCNAQSVFIKKRSIHDDFLYVRNLARKVHKRKTPTLLFKLDIKKAFCEMGLLDGFTSTLGLPKQIM
jgi:hypothetical protein